MIRRYAAGIQGGSFISKAIGGDIRLWPAELCQYNSKKVMVCLDNFSTLSVSPEMKKVKNCCLNRRKTDSLTNLIKDRKR